MPADVASPEQNTSKVKVSSVETTGMRYHELALARWLNRVFLLKWGPPVPVVFSSPTDAFSLFSKLWAESNNPYQYLLDIKDENGKPVYQPHPQPARYPIISVFRRGWRLRNWQNFSIHRMRWLNYPAVSSHLPGAYGREDIGNNLKLKDLGNVTTSRFPVAVDYTFQIDFFSTRPDTQAFFLSQLFNEFWRTGANQLQTWTEVVYPGLGKRIVRLYLDGNIDSVTPEMPEGDSMVEFRSSFSVVMEGFEVDVDYRVYPAFWNLVLRTKIPSPQQLESAFAEIISKDLRSTQNNPVIKSKYELTEMPPKE